MKTSKKFLLALIIIASLIMTSSKAFCSEQVTINSFRDSNYKDMAIELNFSSNSLSIDKVPVSEDFNYIMVFLSNESTVENSKNIFSRSDVINKSAVIYTSSLPNGIYYLQLYRSSQQYSTYYSYYYQKDIPILVTEGCPKLLISPVYDINVRIFETKRTDEQALDYYMTARDDIQSNNNTIIDLAKTITINCTGDYEKAKAIHDWVADNIWYNWDAYAGTEGYGDTSALGTLNSKKSVCQGYANLTAALLRAAKIPAKVVTGFALGVSTSGEGWTDEYINSKDGNHAWNEAYVDNRWIIIDTTWDSDNMYQDGKFSTATGLRGYKYFDISIEAFSYDHKLSEYSESVVPTDKRGFFKLDGYTYYYDNQGICVTGFQQIKDKIYHFDEFGKMLTGWQTISGKKYYFGTNGAMLTSWQTISGKKYYFGTNGAMLTGWQTISEKKYYFGTNGAMLTGWQTISGKKYYFGTNGAMLTGWQAISGKKYYFATNGSMLTGWQTINKVKYLFNSNGVYVKKQ